MPRPEEDQPCAYQSLIYASIVGWLRRGHNRSREPVADGHYELSRGRRDSDPRPHTRQPSVPILVLPHYRSHSPFPRHPARCGKLGRGEPWLPSTQLFSRLRRQAIRPCPRWCAVWWKRITLSAFTSSVPSPGETPARTATTTLWSSCLTTHRRSSVAVEPLIWRSGVPGLRPTCWYGPPASSTAGCISLRPCRPPSFAREDYSMPHDP